MPQTDIITFSNVAVDSDTDIRLVKKGNVVYMLNCIKEGDGDNGVITNIKGTSAGLVTLPAGTNKVVAACDDPERSRVIFFLWNINSGNKLAIFYITKSSTSSGFILNPFSGYDPRNISNPRVVDRYLLFTNGANEPACIDMVKFYNTTNSVSTTDKYLSITADLFTLIKRPPQNKIIPTYITSSDVDYNKVIGAIYQFAYRFVYQDNSKSILSNYTTSGATGDLSIANQMVPSNENVNGSTSGALDQNCIFLNIDDWGDERVKAVEIYVRSSSLVTMGLYDVIKKPSTSSFQATTSGSDYIDCDSISDAQSVVIGQRIMDEDDGALYTVKRIEGSRIYLRSNTPSTYPTTFTGQSIFFYYFFNDKPVQGVSEEDVSRIIDLVPIKANHQELVEDSRIVHAGITEGYDNITTDVGLAFSDTNVDTLYQYAGLGITNSSPYTYIEVGNAYENHLYWICAGYQSVNAIGAFYVAKAGDTSTTIAESLAAMLTARGLPSSVVSSPVRVRTQSTGSFVITSMKANLYYPDIRKKYLTIKTNSKLSLGIVYKDKYGRVGNVNPIYTEIDTSYTGTTFTSSIHIGLDYVRRLQVSVRHVPPEWAYSYQFAAMSDNREYYQYVTPYGAQHLLTKDGNSYIRINKQLELARNATKHKVPSYVYQQGDKIRLMGVGWVGSGTAGKYVRIASKLFNIVDYTYSSGDDFYKKDTATSPAFILDENGNKVRELSSGWIVCDKAVYDQIQTTALLTIPGEQLMIVYEIIRDSVGTGNNYYEIGDEYSVLNPGTSTRSHYGSTQSQSSSDPYNTPAVSVLNWGNAWLKVRHMVECYFTCESNTVSDFYVSDLKPLGRPNVADPNARQKTLGTMLRWGGKFVDNSFINRINRFDFDDYKLLNEKHGSITGLALSGYVLKALTQKKETSIYVNRNILTNADGSENITASSTVLNVADPYVEDRGTLFPHSICVVNRDMYYVDTLRGQFVRSSPNGQIPISDLGKRKAFKALCDAVNSTISSSDVVTYYDDENRLIFVTFLINGTNTTLGFHEPSNSWMDYYSFTPEQGLGVGEECYVASSGQVYRLNDANANRCTFFGQKYDQVVEFVQNENSAVVKHYKDLSLVSNKKWTVYPIEISPNDNNPRGMISRLNPPLFKSKEGVYCAEYLRNMKTSSSTESSIDLINGERLRGNECKHRLTNSENGKVELFRVKIDYEISNTY